MEQTAHGEFRKRLGKLKPRSNMLERNQRISEEGAVERDKRVSKATREIENKKQTARKELENIRRRSKPLEIC